MPPLFRTLAYSLFRNQYSASMCMYVHVSEHVSVDMRAYASRTWRLCMSVWTCGLVRRHVACWVVCVMILRLVMTKLTWLYRRRMSRGVLPGRVPVSHTRHAHTALISFPLAFLPTATTAWRMRRVRAAVLRPARRRNQDSVGGNIRSLLTTNDLRNKTKWVHSPSTYTFTSVRFCRGFIIYHCSLICSNARSHFGDIKLSMIHADDPRIPARWQCLSIYWQRTFPFSFHVFKADSPAC